MTSLQLTLFLATAYNLVLVMIIFWNTRTHQVGRNFAWFILTTAAWMACVAVMQFPELRFIAIWLARATFFIATIMGLTGLWFCVEFPQDAPRFRRLAWVLSALGLPWLGLSWTKWMIPSVQFESWGVGTPSGPLVAPFTLWIGICIIASIIHLAHKARHLRGTERLQVRYVLLGIAGLAIGTIPNLVLPAITQSNRYAPMGPLTSLMVTTTTTYAIARYRLLDITIVLRAGLIYSLTLGLLTLVFALLVPVSEHLLTATLHLPSRTGSFLVALLIALAFQPLRHKIQHWVDLRFFKSVYDFHTILCTAGDALATAHAPETLAATLGDALTRALRPRGMATYLADRQQVLQRYAGTGIWEALPPLLERMPAALRYTRRADDVLLTDELLRQGELAAAIGRQLQLQGIAVALPLIASDRLVGIVFLAEKLSGDSYTVDDLGLLRILGRQAAVALDNVLHYQEMVEINAYHTRLLQTMQDGVVALDPASRVITFNLAAERILGIPTDEALGQPLDALGIGLLPLDEIGEQATELEITTRTASALPVLVTVTPFSRRWEVAASRLVVIRDLSALRALEHEKVQAERFSSMGAMAASLAHEIKNPLVPIKTFAHLLPERYDDAEFRQEFSRTVVNEVERIHQLIGKMLDLVRKPTAERNTVDLRAVLDDLIALIRPHCERQGVRIHTMFAARIPPLVGMREQLYQAILNVLTNAVQAMPNGGELTIGLVAEDGRIICRMSDTGPGVSEEELSRIFEPLYTTKANGHGLGLALTYQFIQAHGGNIRAACAPGGGLSITIALPLRQACEAEVLCS